jgi:hypothetical protein
MGFFPCRYYAEKVGISPTGLGSCYRLYLLFLLLFAVFFPADLLAINAPTITHVAGIAVVPDSRMYAASTDFEVRGNAEADTQIRLYRGSTQVATGTTAATGVWSVNLASQPQGSYIFTAVAYDGIFVSEASANVPVIVDTTGPAISIWYGNSGCRSNSLYQCQVGLIYAITSDGGAGVDFSTAQYLADYAEMPTEGNPDLATPVWNPVPGTISNDGSKQIIFFSE